MGCGRAEQVENWWGGMRVSCEGRPLCQTCTSVLGQGSDYDGPYGLLCVGEPARRSSGETIPLAHAENLRNGPLTSKGPPLSSPCWDSVWPPQVLCLCFVCVIYLFVPKCNK